ncbi:MAG: TIGR02530 family flagellar biosynthesis protein [Anaerolineales bacterium]
MTDPIRIQNNSTIRKTASNPPAPTASKSTVPAQGFAQALEQKRREQEIRFSNHAQKRLQSREIQLSDEGIARLAQAVEKVEKRGGKESLVLMDDLAFIVNVRQRLVVTALDARERGEGVFTQIDSVVLAD